MKAVLGFLGLNKSVPRWGVFIFDLFISVASIFLAYLLRFNFDYNEDRLLDLIYVIPIVLVVRSLVFIGFKTYSGIVQHTSTEDVISIFLSVFLGTSIIAVGNIFSFMYVQQFIVPYSILVIDLITTAFFMSSFRMIVKMLYLEYAYAERELKKVVILGRGDQIVMTKKALDRDISHKYKVIGFISDDLQLKNLKIEGVKVYHDLNSYKDLVKEKAPDLFIFSDDDFPTKVKDEVVEFCLQFDIDVLNVPPMSNWINGELSFNQIKKIKIEDLLGREPIDLDNSKIETQLRGKKVLVTGAAGSIGSGLVRQIQGFSPSKIVLLDQAESPIYELELELREKFKTVDFEVVIGDVRNTNRMENVFKHFTPDVVFHAAAYKHVPLMEGNPSEAILTNVLGTKVVADLAVEYKAEKFVLISTDKAVNPTNVMGASKRLAEVYVQSLSNTLNNGTQFITTRFGNVLGSNGSVIPLFRKQILSGGPVTVTHPEVTRFFMTIPEACQLVLQAAAMGSGGEVFLFDMGESVKIVDLAKKMIKLSGLELGKDIQLVFTGLRPGEKLYEELLTKEEGNSKTQHQKIMIGKSHYYEFSKVNEDILTLIEMFPYQNNIEIVRKMKSIVPEYRSNNSEYEMLDKDN